MTLREARRADAAAIHLLLASSIQTPWSLDAVRRELDLGGASHMLLAEGGARLAGCIHWRLVLDEMEIMNLAVAPDRRRQGVGRQLLASALSHARAAGATAAFLEVRAGNQAAIALYRGMGFQTFATRPRYYVIDGEDARCMCLQLAKPDVFSCNLP